MNSCTFEESLSSGSTVEPQSSSSCTTERKEPSSRRGRPQNFYNGRRINGKRPCLWNCGQYLTEEDMEEHTKRICPRRNEADKFRKDYNDTTLVALRHPNGRPTVKSPEEEFLEKRQEERDREMLQQKLRGAFMDYYLFTKN